MKKTAFLFLLSALICFAPLCVLGTEIDISVVFDVHNSSLVMTGFAGGSAGTPITVNIAPYTGQEPTFSPEHLPIITELFQTGKDGALSCALTLPESMPSGKYSVYFYGDTGQGPERGDQTFLYVSGTDSRTKALLARINQGEDIYTVVTENGNAALLGIDLELCAPYAKESAEITAGLMQSAYTAETFYDTFMGGAAVSMLRSGADPGTVLRTYCTHFGTSQEAVTALSAEAQTHLTQLLAKHTYTTGTLRSIYAECALLAQFQTCTGWAHLQALTLDSQTELTLDLSDYFRLSAAGQNAVFTEMMQEIRTVSSYSGIRALFRTCVARVQNRPQPTGGGSGGTGGGSGHAGGGRTAPVTADTNILNPDNLKPQDDFSDIAGHWARPYIQRLSGSGVITGFPDGTFRPDDTVTRGELAKMVSFAFGYAPASGGAFTDVPEDAWYAPYVYGLAESGILMGDNGLFRPWDSLIRQDAAVVCARLLSGHSILQPPGSVSYPDGGKISGYALPAVQALGAAGIMTGDEQGFRPGDTMTRGEFAALICRMNDLMEGAAA